MMSLLFKILFYNIFKFQFSCSFYFLCYFSFSFCNSVLVIEESPKHLRNYLSKITKTFKFKIGKTCKRNY